MLRKAFYAALLLIVASATSPLFGQTPTYDSQITGVGTVTGAFANAQIIRSSSNSGVRRYDVNGSHAFLGTDYSGFAVNSNIVSGTTYFVTGTQVQTPAPVVLLAKPDPNATTSDVITAGGNFYVSYPDAGSGTGTIGSFTSTGNLIGYQANAGNYTLTTPTFMSHKPGGTTNAIVDDGLGVLLVDNAMNQVGLGFLPIGGVKGVCWYGEFLIVSVGNELQCIDPSNGSIIWTFSTWNSGSQTFSSPMGLTWVNNKLYVADSGNGRIVIFALAPIPLPVELEWLKAKSQTNSVLLNWRTASETNNDRFEVQWSTDAINWQELGFVSGHGTTPSPHEYSFLDTRPLKGLNYYRLRQVDFNGKATYSSIVSAIVDGQPAVKVYPNPAADWVTISNIQEGDRVTLTNAAGVTLQTATASGTTVTLQTAALPAGVHYLSVNGGRTQKLEVLH